MKNKFKLFLLLLSIITSVNFAFAEKETGVSGQVKDAESKKPVEFCTINVFSEKDSLLFSAITNEKGFFILPLARGRYKITSQYIGYKPDTTIISVKTGSEFIGIIKLQPDDNQIGEVTVTGKSESIKIDKDEYIVTTKMKTGAANTKDVLDKVNGITYDRYNNSVKVDNEDNIMILVNGLQKDQDYILNLNPERLKKIEVIRDPSGRYALEGYSAVINIILKDDYKGLEFLTEDQILSDIDNQNKKYFPVNYFSGSINYTYNKINVYGKYAKNILNLGLLSENTKEYDNGLTINKYPNAGSANMNIDRMYDRATLGLDYFINPKQTISYEGHIKGNFFRDNIESSLFNVSELQNETEINNFNSENFNTSTNISNSHSVFYKSIIDKNNTLNVDFTYSNSSDKYSNNYFENNVLIYNQSGKNDNKNTKFYAEFNHTINSTYNFNKIIGIKLGAAAETSSPEVNGNKKSYFIYQPYADIKIKPFKMLDIRLKYRSSSNYPSVNQANPDTIYIDNNTLSVGNPYVAPSVTHRLSARFNIMGGLASVEPYYHFSDNYISQTGKLNDNGIFEYTYNNAGQYKHYGFKVGLTVPFGKSLFWQNNADFFRSSILYDGNLNSIRDWTMSSNLIYVNKKYKTTTGIIYQNNLKKHITAQGYNMWNNDFWGYMIQQPFFKQKLNVMIFYMLPIDFGVDYNQGSYLKTNTYIETNTQDISILKNILMFRITFRLNKGQAVHKTKKDFKEEENQEKKGGIF